MVDTQKNSLTELIKKIEILNTPLETDRKRDDIAVLNIVEGKFSHHMTSFHWQPASHQYYHGFWENLF